MFRIKTITSAVIALGLSAAIPAFAKAADRGHNERNDSRAPARVEHRVEARPQSRVESRPQGRVESRPQARVESHVQAHVERRVEPQRNRVVVEQRVERNHVIRDVHVHNDYHYDRGIRFGVSVGPSYQVIPSYPVYVNTDCDYAVSLADVPGCVLDTAGRECGGAIESVRLIRQNGVEYYRLIVDSRDGAFEVHVDRAGRLISVGRC